MEWIERFLNRYGDGFKPYYKILYERVVQQKEYVGSPIIEIGTFFAGSALTMAYAAQQAHLGQIYSIDIRMRESLTFDQALDFGRYRESVGGALFTEHIIGLSGLGHLITSIYAMSDSALELVSHLNPCLVFVDGNHDYQHTRRDIESYGKLLISGGTLVCHDYDDRNPECKRAIGECVRDCPTYTGFTEIDNTTCAQKI